MSERKLDSNFESAEESPGLALWRATNAWQSAQRQALKRFDLSHVQFVLLASLVWFDAQGPITQRNLCEHANLDEMMTSQVLRTLERKGFIKREKHPLDGRAVSLSATAAGIKLANQAVRVVEKVDEEFFAGLSDQGKKLARDLSRLTHRFNDSN